MNLYIRYFDNEVVVTSVDDALDFIRGIEEFTYTPQFEKEFREYALGNTPYPKRYKVRARVYFIVIKTVATTIEEFKANGKHAVAAAEGAEGANDNASQRPLRPKDQILMKLHEENPGWYEGTVKFKRVMLVPATGKYDYVDNTFTARVKAMSGQDCYERIVEHLQSRPDMDPRCQYPTPKGKNFTFEYLGIKPLQDVLV
ncbi:MAG: hypothetical protein IJS59_03915 [Bacteroidaceae bacterium]|nr:hypothetical protein [Bacteroidaceae bacterium]